MLASIRTLTLLLAAVSVLVVGCNDGVPVEPDPMLPDGTKLFLVGTEVDYDISDFPRTGLRAATGNSEVASASLVGLDTDAPVLRIAVLAAGETQVHLFADEQRLSSLDVDAVEVERVRVDTVLFDALTGPLNLDVPEDAFETDSIAILADSEVALAYLGVDLERIDPSGEAALMVFAALDAPLRETDCLGGDYKNVCSGWCIIGPPRCLIADEAGVHTVRAEFAGGHSLATNLRAVAPSDVVRVELFVQEPNTTEHCSGKIHALGYDAQDRLIIGLNPSFELGGTTMPRAPADADRPWIVAYPSWQRPFRLDPTAREDVVVTFNGIEARAPVRGIPCE